MIKKPSYEELEQRVKELEKKSLEQNSLERELQELLSVLAFNARHLIMHAHIQRPIEPGYKVGPSIKR
jgi:hypothetical protein